MYRSGIGYGGWAGPRGYLAAGLGYPYGGLAFPFWGYPLYGGLGYGYPYYGGYGYGNYGGGYPY